MAQSTSGDARRLGITMMVTGGVAAAGALAVDWVRYADDDVLAAREAIFDFSVATHVVFFAGLCVTALGALVMLFGRYVLRGGVFNVVVALAAVGLVSGSAAVASASKYSDPIGNPTGDHHADTGSTSTDDHADMDSTATDHHAGAGSANGAAPASTDPAADPEGDDAHEHAVSDPSAPIESGQVIPSTADGTSPCEIAQPAPASPGQAGAGEGGQEDQEAGEHGHRGLVKQYPLTAAERKQLAAQMVAARSVIDQFPTVADAEAAGYAKSTPFVPCIGAHYTKLSLIGKFDAAAPSELLYDGTDPDSKILGLSYLLLNVGGPPEGFAGENDIWHQHNANGGLCLKTGSALVIGGEELSDEECAARGGYKAGDVMEDIWMVHAWVAPGWECSWGVFAGECPELGGRLGGTAFD
jgi:hypothetical protein